MVATRREEDHVAGGAPAGHVARLGDHVEAEHLDVEAAHALDVGGAQVHVADADARVDRVGGLLRRDERALGGIHRELLRHEGRAPSYGLRNRRRRPLSTPAAYGTRVRDQLLDVELQYGAGSLTVSGLPRARTTVVEPRHLPSVADEAQAVTTALREPVAGRLCARASGRARPLPSVSATARARSRARS